MGLWCHLTKQNFFSAQDAASLWKLLFVIPVGCLKSKLSHPSVADRVVIPCPVNNCPSSLAEAHEISVHVKNFWYVLVTLNIYFFHILI